MKIQPNISKPISKKHASNKPATTAFDDLLSAQLEEGVENTNNPQDTSSETAHVKKTNIEETLQTLEDAILHLSQNHESHQKAHDAILELQSALQDASNQLPLSAKDREEAETLLTVEAKRLETLRKYE